MRVKVLKAFALIFFLGLAGAAFGQAPYSLLSMTNVWKYNITNQGVNWRGTNFVDTSWPSGPGALGFDTNTSSLLFSQMRTTLPTNNGSARVLTYYFRNHFTITNANPFEIT